MCNLVCSYLRELLGADWLNTPITQQLIEIRASVTTMSPTVAGKILNTSQCNHSYVYQYLCKATYRICVMCWNLQLVRFNSILEERKSRLRLGNACYHLVQNLLSSRLLCKNLKSKIYRTVILPVVLYGCETWSLTLREERKLRVFENMMLRRIFGPTRDEVTGDWMRFHNEELNDLYSSPNIVQVIKSRRMRWAGHVAHMGEERGAYRFLVGKPEGKRPLGRPRRRWGDNIGMDL